MEDKIEYPTPARSVDRMVADLRRIVLSGHIAISAQAGEYLLTNIFHGNVAAARAKNGNKDTSLRELAERAEEFGMTASGVRRAIPLALQARLFGKELTDRLPVSHHVALLPLKDHSKRKLLAELAVDEAMTVEQLRKRVYREQKKNPGGRKPIPRARLVVGRVDRLLAGESNLAAGLKGVEPMVLDEILHGIVRARTVLDRIEKSMRANRPRPRRR